MTIKQRYEKHRDKLSTDIGKLVNNQNGLSAVLGQTVLRRWFFILPDHDNKDLIAFANKKACEVPREIVVNREIATRVTL